MNHTTATTTTTTKRATHYIVRSSAAHMPSSCWGTYRRVAVIEVDAGVDHVSMISEHARGVVRVVRTWGPLNVGTTDRCAYARASSEAEYLAREMNAI